MVACASSTTIDDRRTIIADIDIDSTITTADIHSP